MRNSALLLASALALDVSNNHVADAMGAVAEIVNDPNRAHTFLELKNDTSEDERMFPSPSETASQGIFVFTAGNAQKIMEAEKTLPQVPLKSLDVIFGDIRAGAVGSSKIDRVNNVLETMEIEEMKRAVEVFTSHNKFLADKFVEQWGIKAVATALVRAKHSQDKTIKTNGKMLWDNLVGSLDKTAKGDYLNVFNRLELNDQDKKFRGLLDGRVDLLDDLIKSHHDGQPNDRELFTTLQRGFKGIRNLAGFIGLAAANSRTAEPLEKRFIIYLVNDRKIDNFYIIRWLGVTEYGYELFKRREFNMVEKFLLMRDVPISKIPETILKALLDAHYESEPALANMLSNGVSEGDATSGIYESLFFQYMKNRGYNSDNINGIFDEYTLKSYDYAEKFVNDYKAWYDHPHVCIPCLVVFKPPSSSIKFL